MPYFPLGPTGKPVEHNLLRSCILPVLQELELPVRRLVCHVLWMFWMSYTRWNHPEQLLSSPVLQDYSLFDMEEHESTKSQLGAQLTCCTIPYQQNHGFYGRADELSKIAQAFPAQSPSPVIRTVAIWGTRGVGKSQIALEYAYRRWNTGTSVVLWISSETEGEFARSVRKAAETMRLEGYSENNTADENRHLVLQWLKKASMLSRSSDMLRKYYRGLKLINIRDKVAGHLR